MEKSAKTQEEKRDLAKNLLMLIDLLRMEVAELTADREQRVRYHHHKKIVPITNGRAYQPAAEPPTT